MKTKIIFGCLIFLLNKNSFSQTTDTVCPFRYSNPNGLGLNPEKFIEYNGSMYFIGNYEYDTKQYLWKSDGTWGGSFRVKEINPGNPNFRYTSVWDIHVINNLMYFYDTYEKSIWRSDGTANGTFTLMKGKGIYKFEELNSFVYFFVQNSSSLAEFWQTDGSVNGTQLIKTLPTVRQTFGNWPSFKLTKLNNKLLFDGIDDVNGVQLWETDGTSDGTKLLRKLTQANTFSITIFNFTNYKNNLYFSAKDSSGNYRLWRTDGTENGTRTFSNKFNFPVTQPIEFKNKLFFNAQDTTYPGNFGQLFSTDGTDTGTHPVYSKVFKLSGVNVSFDPSNFTIMNNELYMTAKSEKYGFQIWKTDGTTNGTVRITAHDSMKGRPKNLVVFDNHIIYLAGIYSVYTPLMHYTNGNIGDFHYQEAYDDWKDNAYESTEFFPFKGALYFNSNCTSLDEFELYRFYFSKPSAINNLSFDKIHLNVYPNPSNGKIMIKNNQSLGHIMIYNSIGQIVKEINTENHETEMNIEKSGIYFIKYNNENSSYSQKILIQN